LVFNRLLAYLSGFEYMKNPTYRYFAIEMIGALFMATNFILFLNQFEVGMSIGSFFIGILDAG